MSKSTTRLRHTPNDNCDYMPGRTCWLRITVATKDEQSQIKHCLFSQECSMFLQERSMFIMSIGQFQLVQPIGLELVKCDWLIRLKAGMCDRALDN